MRHTMRLDKIMIWISIHLHSLARSISPSVTTRVVRTVSSSAIRVSQSYARYVIIRMLCSYRCRCDATVLVSLPSKLETRHGQTSNQDPDRQDARGAIKGAGETRGRDMTGVFRDRAHG